MNKTTWVKSSEVKREWYVIDATNLPLGRLASIIAIYLTGKHKPNYVPNIDMGDFVIVINASKIKLTGNKSLYKRYTRYSGYPGGLKISTTKDLLKRNDYKFIILHAVKGMLPKNSFRSNYMHRLRVFNNDKHMHEAQKPKLISVKL